MIVDNLDGEKINKREKECLVRDSNEAIEFLSSFDYITNINVKYDVVNDIVNDECYIYICLWVSIAIDESYLILSKLIGYEELDIIRNKLCTIFWDRDHDLFVNGERHGGTL